MYHKDQTFLNFNCKDRKRIDFAVGKISFVKKEYIGRMGATLRGIVGTI